MTWVAFGGAIRDFLKQNQGLHDFTGEGVWCDPRRNRFSPQGDRHLKQRGTAVKKLFLGTLLATSAGLGASSCSVTRGLASTHAERDLRVRPPVELCSIASRRGRVLIESSSVGPLFTLYGSDDETPIVERLSAVELQDAYPGVYRDYRDAFVAGLYSGQRCGELEHVLSGANDGEVAREDEEPRRIVCSLEGLVS